MSRITVTKDEWIAALESGDYFQGQGRLVNFKGKMCCLGVLCDLSDDFVRVDAGFRSASGIQQVYLIESHLLPDWLDVDQASTAAAANDEHGKSFAEIAEWIREGMPMNAAVLPEETA